MTNQKLRQFIYYLSGLVLLSGSGFSSEAQSRIYVNEYLNIGVGARGLGMSGANVASTGDVYSSYWNPAGLLNIEEDIQVGLMHAQYFSNISKYDFAALALPNHKKKHVLAFSFIRFGTDDIPYTLDYVRPDGSFDESKLRGITAGDYAGIISFAKELKIFKNGEIKTRLGVNGKVLYRNIGKMANAWGVGVDAGIQMDYKRWTFGLMIKDFTNTYTNWSFNLTEQEKQIFGETGNEIPVKSYELMRPRFNIGTAYNFMKPENKFQILAELGVDITTDGIRNTILTSSSKVSIDPKLGVEASYKNMIFLRAGVGNFYNVYDNSDTTHQKKYLIYQPSVGAGFKYKSFSIDYSFTNLRVQGAPLMSHIVSLRLDILRGKTILERQKEEEDKEHSIEFTPSASETDNNSN